MSHADLRRKYDDDGWEDMLQACAAQGGYHFESQPGRGQTTQKTLCKYREADGTVIAVLFRYQRIDGDKLVVRMLRDGDTVFSGPAVAATIPGLA